MILLVVLMVVSVLSFAALAMVVNLSVESRAFQAETAQLQLQQVLLSGVEYVKAFCELPRAEQLAFGGPDDNPSRFQRVAVVGPSGDDPVGYFSVLVGGGSGEEVASSTIQFGLESESAKLNLRSLLAWELTGTASGRECLMHLPGMTESVADAILDWIDPDDQRRPYGAESDYYAGVRLPYRPRNDLPVALDELLLVRGVGRAELLGDGGSGSALPFRSGGFSVLGQAKEPSGPWIRYLTAYSGERNVSGDGSPRIHLNDPDLSRLHEQISREFFPELADFVIFFRQFGPVAEAEEASEEAESASDRELMPDFSRPGGHLLTSIFDPIGRVVEVELRTGENRRIACPLASSPERLREYLPKWADRTTTTTDPVIYGRIDILRAPREVLLAVPGMDSATVERILSSRKNPRGGARGEVPTLAWLYLDGIMPLEDLRRLEPFITTGGDVWTAELVAEGPESRGVRLRARVTIDATRVPARQIYWKHRGQGTTGSAFGN
jgi:hypothetical protein